MGVEAQSVSGRALVAVALSSLAKLLVETSDLAVSDGLGNLSGGDAGRGAVLGELSVAVFAAVAETTSFGVDVLGDAVVDGARNACEVLESESGASEALGAFIALDGWEVFVEPALVLVAGWVSTAD